MAISVETHFVEQYTTNLRAKLQIQGGKLRPHVMSESYTGEGGVAVDFMGPVDMQEVTGRFQPMGRVDPDRDRVWVYPTDYDLPQMEDTFDLKRLLVDPTNIRLQQQAMGVARQIDNIIFDAFFADAKTGKNGSTTTAFDTTNHRVDAAVGAAADTGLNVDKILKGLEIMENNNVDVEAEQPILAITPRQHNDLLRQTQVINTDYFNNSMGRPVLVDGRVREWGLCRIVVSNLVQQNAGATYRLLPLWVPSGMHLGVWCEPTARIDDRPDLKGIPSQLYVYMTMGATRTEAARVIQIECTE